MRVFFLASSFVSLNFFDKGFTLGAIDGAARAALRVFGAGAGTAARAAAGAAVDGALRGIALGRGGC